MPPKTSPTPTSGLTAGALGSARPQRDLWTAARERTPIDPSESAPPSQEIAAAGTGAGTTAPAPLAPHLAGHTKAAAQLGPGLLVGHYELIRLLGQGGMGSVFLARDNRLGRRVAIKFLHANSAHQTRRFILEARLTARCSHENIVVIHEADEFQGAPYMVLEYLRGASLKRFLADRQPLPPARVAELMVPVLRALTCAHAAGIVHRDLKPDNIFVTDGGTIKVLDFGISKVLQGEGGLPSDEGEDMAPAGAEIQSADSDADLATESASLTVAGALMGTLPYMSPEQWRCKGIDHRADIWAVGIILYRMLSGRHPLQGLRGMALSVVGNYREPMPSLHASAPALPADLIELVDRCLHKRRADRWPDAASLLKALETFLPGRAARNFAIDACPYAGLAAFQESDADRFFGRDGEIAALVNRIRDQPLIGIVGASGSGKSSIARAGVIPALKRSGECWDAVILRPGRSPLLTLAGALMTASQAAGSAAASADRVAALAQELAMAPGQAGARLRDAARRSGKRYLVFIDQFEELYTQVESREERRAFTACLCAIADDASSPTRVLLSIRADFLERVSEDQPFLCELTQGLNFLAPPDRDGMREAILQPARLAGYAFESEAIVEEMLDHLAAAPGALPLLQFAASKLWEARDRDSKKLTLMRYREMGGIAGALSTHADTVLHEIAPQKRKVLRSILMRLVTPERTRAIVAQDELRELAGEPEVVDGLIQRLVQARLLVVQTGGSGVTVELVHESLIHSWPALRRWIEEAGEDVAFLEQLRLAARQWEAKGRSRDLLWRGEVVAEAERFQHRHRGPLPAGQRDFLKAVFAQKARAIRTKRLIAGSLALVLLALSGVMSFLKLEADEQRVVAQKAEARALAQARIAEERLAAIEQKERARLAAEAKADLSEKEARAQEQRATAEAQRAQQEVRRRLEEMQKKEEAEAAALLAEQKKLAAERLAREEALHREEAERQAKIEEEKKRAAEALAQREALQRAEAERLAELEAAKKKAAEAAAAQARREKERLAAEEAARKARIGAIEDF